jgi:peptidoglycan/xylan/chitin deacetylase (PgdA/CDA1 family)
MGAFSKSLLYQVAHKFKDALFFIETQKPIIALTFDDVGDASTQLIIDSINHYNIQNNKLVKATFFVTTSYLENPEKLITNILASGHEIGNHGIYDRTHADLTPTEFNEEIIQAHQTIDKYTSTPIKWFRPARGRYNQTMLKTLQKMEDKYGYIPKFALASEIPLDTFLVTRNPEFTFNYLNKFIFPGAILLLHGGTLARVQNTVATLSLLLPHLHKLGYEVVTLTELAKC